MHIHIQANRIHLYHEHGLRIIQIAMEKLRVTINFIKITDHNHVQVDVRQLQLRLSMPIMIEMESINYSQISMLHLN